MRLYQYTIALLSLALAASCSKDLGNYEYNEINELNIGNVNAEYKVRTGIDTLRIKPDIKTTLDEGDTSRYRYLWILRTGTLKFDTIGKTRNLNYPVKLDPTLYELYYRLLDKKTGVTWNATTKVVVSTASSRGWLLMGENEQGFAEAEMLSMINDTVHIKNILSTSGLPPLKAPVSFVHTGGGEREIKLWAFTKTGSYFLNRATLTGSTTNNLKRITFMSENIDPATMHPIALAPQIRNAAGALGATTSRAMITVGGDLFAASSFITGGDFFNNPVNRVAAEPDVRLPAAPYLMFSIGNTNSGMNAVVWYDKKNERFLNFASFFATSSTLLTDGSANNFFPWSQPAGRTLIYAENTRNTDGNSTHGNSFAIMKDADHAHHIYKFYANGTNPAKRGYYLVSPIATDFDKARFYAFSSNRTVVFYAVGNKLYAYDYNPVNQKIYQFPEITDEISMLKFDTQYDHIMNSLYIATYNSTTKGTLKRYRVGTNPNVVELLPQENSTWTGLVKIKDINWRAVN